MTHLFVRVDVDVTLDALLSHVRPAVPTHPLALALGALVLTETSLLALVGCETFTFGSGLKYRGQTVLKCIANISWKCQICCIQGYMSYKSSPQLIAEVITFQNGGKQLFLLYFLVSDEY